MPESGLSILFEYEELFQELGELDGLVKLRVVTRTSVQSRATVSELALGNPIVNDQEDREMLGITVPDLVVFRVWGGAFLIESGAAEDVIATQVFNDTMNNFKRAALPGGGIVWRDNLYSLVKEGTKAGFYRGFSLGSFVMQWYLVGVRPVFTV